MKKVTMEFEVLRHDAFYHVHHVLAAVEAESPESPVTFEILNVWQERDYGRLWKVPKKHWPKLREHIEKSVEMKMRTRIFISTWLDAFYPVPARALELDPEGVEATKHSLTKWRGIAKAEEYGLSLQPREVLNYGEPVLQINNTSCALCEQFHTTAPFNPCNNCPLARTLGEPCDTTGQPYDTWQDTLNAAPMIEALEKTLQQLDDGTLPPRLKRR